jgi:N12 class adenine-specific DNA methylase
MNKQTVENQLAIIKLVKDAPANLSKEQKKLLKTFTGWGTVYKALDPSSEGFYKEAYQQLLELLTEDELKIAQSVTPNAYYTHPEIAEAIWEIVKGLGFAGGNILEPSCGSGIFISNCPDDLRHNSKFIGIELDPISAKVAEMLHPEATIYNQGFENLVLQHGEFDLAIGNVPFGATPLWDQNLGIKPQKIHNFFLLKALKLVRKGGLVAFLTSTGFLDSKSGQAFRQVVSQYGELVLANRLPSGTFLGNAGTEVTIDLVVFQKHLKKPESYQSAFSEEKVFYPDWVESYPISHYRCKDNEQYNKYLLSSFLDFDKVGGWSSRVMEGVRHHIDSKKGVEDDIYELSMNQYFVANLQHLLGMLSVDKLYGGGSRGALISIKGLDPVLELKAIASSQKPRYHNYPLGSVEVSDQELAKMPNGSFLIVDGNVVQKKAGKFNDAQSFEIERVEDPEKILLFIQLVNVLTALIEAQKTSNENKMQSLREQLNIDYDQWVSKYGYLHANSGLDDDTRYYLLLALETPENVKGSKKYLKTDIFYKRTASPAMLLEKCDRTQDALVVSINRFGGVDIDCMANLLGQSCEWVCEDLKANKLAYLNPITQKWELPEVYLSGNIRKKLEGATEANLPENIDALEAVLPKWLLPDADINICVDTAVEIGVEKFRDDQAKFDVSLGQTWIDVDIYRAFMLWLFQLPTNSSVSIRKFSYPSNEYKIINRPNIPKDNQYGTIMVTAVELLELALNGMTPKVMITVDTIDGQKRVEDKNATLAAIAAQDKIKDAFQKWIFSDLQVAVHLTKKYNSEYNTFVVPAFSGKHLTFPGINPDIQLRDHQKDAAWRGLNQKSFLLGWEVGGGKTIGFIVAAMEQKRLGLISKPMFVVLNSTISDIEAEFRKLYPTAKLLVGNEKSTSPQNRWKFLYKIAVGDWDAIIITHSQFKAISMSPQSRIEFIKSELAAMREQVEDAQEYQGQRKSLKSRATIESFYKAKLQLAMEQLDNNQDDIFWELLGVDGLVIDEFHQFKNLFRNTKKDDVAGMPNSAAERAFDCYLKIRHILINGGRFILATGTPVSNTLAEAWTMLRYLNLEYLEEIGLQHFDSFFELFFEATSEFEILPYGYKLRKRVRQIKNHPELVAILNQFMDVRNADDLKLPRPSHEVISVGCPPSGEQLDYLQELCDRYEAFMTGGVEPCDDNPLKIIGDGRACQLDSRLRIFEAENLISSKVNQCIRNTYRIWELTTSVKGAQAVFCDFSVPKKGIFNVYQYVKDILVLLGIPKDQIAFIQDYKTKAQKKFLLHLINAGEIRVVLGSTSKLGTGVNMQKRLFALHHLDAPWRPSDIAQREGRVVRQGNLFNHVLIFRYVTQGGYDGKIPGFDAFIWQAIESKAKVFTNLFRANHSQRRIETDDSAIMSMSMLKVIATGDDGFLRLEEIKQEVKKAEIIKREWQHQSYSVRTEYSSTLNKIKKSREEIDNLQKDLEYLQQNPFRTLTIKIDGTPFSFEEGTKILEKTHSQILEIKNIWIGEFRVKVERYGETYFGFSREANIEVKTKTWLRDPEYDLAVKIENLTNGLVESILRWEAKIPDIEERAKRFENYPEQQKLYGLIKQQQVLEEKYGDKSSVQEDDDHVGRIQKGAIQKRLNGKKKDVAIWINDLKKYLKIETPEVTLKEQRYLAQDGYEAISNSQDVTEFEFAGFKVVFSEDNLKWTINGKGCYEFDDLKSLFDAIASFDEYLKERINQVAGILLEAEVIKEIPDLDNLLGEDDEAGGKEAVYEFWHKNQINVAYSGVDPDFLESMKLAIANEEEPDWVETTCEQVQILLNKIYNSIPEIAPEATPENAIINIEAISEEIVDEDEDYDWEEDEDWDTVPTIAASDEQEVDEDEEIDWEKWELDFIPN